ncbi:MAG: MerR family transcriptional regulator [Spirosomataceae bacterium]
MPNTLDPNKRYYSIKEVADHFEVTIPTLRVWEDEFPSLKPSRNNAGDRQYTAKDIEQVKLIYHLLKEKKMKIEGAKDYIKNRRKKETEVNELIANLERLKGFLMDIRSNLDQLEA